MLSLCILTKNSASYIENLLRGATAFADEIVVAVDSSSTDATETICRKYADRLFSVESVGIIERAQKWMYAQCTGDWILRLDDDELPSAGFVRALPRLLQDKEITHYWLPRRWMIGGDSKWIAERPWWPDWHNRLFRNIPSIVRASDQVHTIPQVLGDSRFFSDGCIYHMDLVYHTEEERQQKVARYERISTGKGMAHYYLLDEDSLKTRPVPADDQPWVGSRPNWLAELFGIDRQRRLGNPAITEVSLDEMRRVAMGACDYDQNFFQATLEVIDCPATMKVDQYYAVDIDLRNDSPVAWASPGRGVPEVRVSHHWLHESGEMYQYDNDRTNLPHILQPGDKARMNVSLTAPRQPGRFILQWNLVIEGVAWFSQRQWPCPEMVIEVAE